MDEDFQLNTNFMDENPQGKRLSETAKKSDTPRVQPHMHTIAQENPNP